MKIIQLLFFVVLFAMPSVNLAQSAKQTESFSIVEQMPIYPGGEEAMMKFIAENLKYPESAKNAKVQGMILVQFVINKEGAVQDVKVLRPLQADCDTEAIRLISAMPNWQPGMQDNKPVNVTLNLPIQFKLSE
jgi:TonB family protein